MGARKKLKAGAAGGKEGKPTFRHHSGRDSQCRAGSAPCGCRVCRVNKCRRGQAPIAFSTVAGTISAASGLGAGMQGAKPLA